jgi:hypothetical protein
MTQADHARGSASPGADAPVRHDAVPYRTIVLTCTAILSLTAAVIHFTAAGPHFREYWAYGVFMLAAGWAQLLWAAAAIVRPSRALLWAGMAINVTIIAVYVVTRTAGDLIGPTPRTAEPVGFGDVLCTVLEAAVAAACLWQVVARRHRLAPRRHLAQLSYATGVAAGMLLSVALVAGGPDMVMAAGGAGGHRSGTSTPAMHMIRAQASRISLATATPAGAITQPDPMMQMAPGMRMASAIPCTAQPTTAQRAAAVRLVDATWQRTRRFRSLATARAAGYRPITPTGLPVVHYLNVKYYIAMLTSGRVLNPAEPQSLVYANTPGGAVLVAAMYITAPGRASPQPGGCLTQWHVHTNLCLTSMGAVVGIVTAATPTCPLGSANHVTPPMMHVWFVPVPGGPTAIDASDAQIVRAAERVPAPRNGPA